MYIPEIVRYFRQLTQEVLDHPLSHRTIGDQLGAISDLIWGAFLGQEKYVAQWISNYHPQYLGESAPVIFNSGLQRRDIHLCVAREYGFLDWDELKNGNIKTLDSTFEDAVDSLLRGDVVLFRKMIKKNPRLLTQRSAYGHGAGLIHYCTSNGVETRRQVVPDNLEEMVKILVGSEASKGMKMKAYGGFHTASQLFESSAHPKWAAVDRRAIIKLLS